VLIPTTDGTYRELLISYDLTPQEKQSLMNGGMVDTKGRTTITELAKGTYAVFFTMTSCGYVTEQAWGMCSDGLHGISNIMDCAWVTNPPRGKHPPQLINIVVYRCTFLGTGNETGGTGWWAGPGGGTDNGGGGELCPDCPTDPTQQPCNGNGVSTGLIDPNTNIGEGGCAGIPTVIEVPSVRITPCQRLNNLWDPTKANAKPLIISTMYEGAGKEKGESGINFKRQQDGTITHENVPHTDSTATKFMVGGQYYLAIHSHPKIAYPMFSWSDIYAAFKLIVKAESYNRQHSALLLVCEDTSGVKQTYAITFETLGATIEERLADPANL